MRDTVGLLRLGIPSVALVHEPFETLARLQANQLGWPEASLLIFPQDFVGKDSTEAISRKAREVAERLVAFLLGMDGQAAAPR